MKTFKSLLVMALFLLLNSPHVADASINRRELSGSLRLFNLHLNETAEIKYLNENGSINKDGVAQAQHLLRCRTTNETHQIPLKLLELVNQIQDHFGASMVYVISGYRSPEFNADLFKRGHKVAQNSRHMRGEAMDIRIPGVPTKVLRDYAASLKIGGVGFYPENQFVHVDVGPVRYW